HLGLPAMDQREFLDLGLRYHRNGQFLQAEQIYRQILQADPANADVWMYLGRLQSSQGRFDEAATSLQQALGLRPQNASIYNELGIAFAQQGKIAEAVAG